MLVLSSPNFATTIYIDLILSNTELSISLLESDNVTRLVKLNVSELHPEIRLLISRYLLTAGVSCERSRESNAPKSYKGRKNLKRVREVEEGEGRAKKTKK